jgi:hypothetical protein
MSDQVSYVYYLFAENTYQDMVGGEHRPALGVLCRPNKPAVVTFIAHSYLVGDSKATARIRYDSNPPVTERGTVHRDKLILARSGSVLDNLIGAHKRMFEFTPVMQSARIARFALADTTNILPRMRARCRW